MTQRPILINVRGVIIKDDRLLLVKMNDENGIYFTYPGGTVRTGESIYERLERSITMQTCSKIRIHRLLMAWEYIPEREGFRYGERQRVTLLFLCEPAPGKEPQMPKIADPNQLDVLWIPLRAIDELPIIPVIGKELHKALDIKINTGYLFLNSTK